MAGTAWSAPGTVAGFSQSAPNGALLQFAHEELRLLHQPGRRQRGRPRALDIGCGAARNAVPLAELGWDVVGLDLSWPMISAAGHRAVDAGVSDRLRLALAPMDAIPVRDGSIDLVIAHGIWNLARSGWEFRRAVHEAARVATTGAALFVFTFSRHTLPAEAEAVAHETFVFTQFSGQPQCFLTETQLVSELAGVGFEPDPLLPVRELNRPRPGALPSGTGPVIYEGLFRRR